MGLKRSALQGAGIAPLVMLFAFGLNVWAWYYTRNICIGVQRVDDPALSDFVGWSNDGSKLWTLWAANESCCNSSLLPNGMSTPALARGTIVPAPEPDHMVTEEEEDDEEERQAKFHELDYLKEGGIDWLHIPKTGTSLGNLVVLFACPELPEGDYILENAVKNVPEWCLDRFRINEIHRSFLPLADHFSLTNRTEDQLRRVFTMLRKPILRVTSGYHYVRGYKKANATAAELCNYFKWTKRIHGGFYGMTKVILGYHLVDIRKGLPTVANTSRPSDAEVQEAIRRVNIFAFTGITDYWKTSECIFNNKFMMYSRNRSDIVSRHYRSKPKSVSYPSKYPCHDDVDEQVFQAALRRLIRESIEYDCYDVLIKEMSDSLV